LQMFTIILFNFIVHIKSPEFLGLEATSAI